MTTQTATVHDLLIETKRIIATPKTWTQHTSARDKKDRTVTTSSPDACKFCVTEAFDRACHNLNLPHDSNTEFQARQRLRATTHRKTGIHSITSINDDQGFESVHAILDDAIQAAA